ncbi:M15 family metallopeptidase [Clostridium sp. CCUG 7971]|uniref:M15 family metallopeptidase n=1 Tax=Clostridium sp. CCUG 7971 TaxID=2811414 RepID=UPI001ABB9AED|nr:M15 family metallopeptidase [Clostridium sp. CCUG 7971]MBO3445179.1 M15 family metallopeptidase [Clostridium sp. CCUG 7971]
MKKIKFILPIIVILAVTVILFKVLTPEKTLTPEKISNKSNSNIITNTLLVNNDNKLDKNYKPINSDIPNIPFIDSSTDEEKQMEEIASKSVEKLFNQAKEEGIKFLATSAYRSYTSQKEIYTKKVISDGIKKANEYVAKPGTSEHQTGLCIDVTNEDRWFVGSTKEAIWLAENAHKFGFIIRYPKGKEDVTGKSYEPWHIRYVGKDIAKEIHINNLTLEEYIARKN